jgi:flagellar basal body-associated protein FliL
MIMAAVNDDSRTAWWVTVVALLSLALGFLAVSFLAEDKAVDTKPPRYVEMRKLDVQSSGGLVVLSLDLEVDHADLARVEQQKAALEASFREALTQLDPARMYSRAGKEALSAGLRDVANHVLGTNLVTGVYFGDFRIYNQAPK